MRTALLIVLAAGLGACRTPPLTPRAVDLDAHLEAAAAPAASAAGNDADLAALEATTRAIVAAWDEKLAAPQRLSLVRAFDAEPLAALRAAARSADFGASLAAGLGEDQLVAAAFERSPRVRAAHRKLRAAVNQYAQVTYVDTILSQYASFQRDARTHVGMPLGDERLGRSYPFPGSLELKAALVAHAVEEARARHAAAVRDVVVEARSLHARYVFVGRAIGVDEAMLRYLEQMEDAARSKLETGRGTKAAVIRTQVEIADLRNELLTRRQEQDVLRADVARLLDLPAEVRIGPPTPPQVPEVPPDPAALRSAAITHQPNLEAAEARVRRMQTMIELAELTAYPAFSAGLADMAGISHATGGSDKTREPFTTRPKVKPDPWFGGKEAYLREAREGLRAAQAHAREVRNATTFAVESAHAALETAARLRALYREVQLAQAEQAYRDAAAGYAADREGLQDVLDALRRLLRFRLQADRATRDVHLAHARLEGAVGRALAPPR